MYNVRPLCDNHHCKRGSAFILRVHSFFLHVHVRASPVINQRSGESEGYARSIKLRKRFKSLSIQTLQEFTEMSFWLRRLQDAPTFASLRSTSIWSQLIS